MSIRSRIARLAVATLVCAATAAAYGCGAERNTAAPSRMNLAAAEGRSFVGANPFFDPRVASPHGLHPSAVAALQRTAWVGRIHRDGLADFARQRDLGSRGRNTNCAILATVVSSYVAQVEAESGIPFTGQGRRDVVREAVKGARPCAGYEPMSLWSMAAPASSAGGYDDLVSDLGLAYGESVIDAVQGTNGYRPNVDYAVYGVLAQATAAGVSAADLEYIAGVGNESISSSQYWYEVEVSHGGPLPAIDPMIIWPYVAIDALGCGLGAGSAAIGGERRAGALLGQCALIGLGSSAGAWVGTKII